VYTHWITSCQLVIRLIPRMLFCRPHESDADVSLTS